MKQQNRYLPYTPEEFKKIMDSKDKLSKLFLLTGVRRFELKQLFTRYESGAFSIVGKGNKFRLIPATKEILELVEELREEWSWKSDRSINLHFEKLSKDIGLFKDGKGIVFPHRFRATFATKLINNGVDLVTIQTLMGHSKISTTAGYIKINASYLRSSIEMLSNPKYDLDGMTNPELKQEIMRLRRRLNRMVV